MGLFNLHALSVDGLGGGVHGRNLLRGPGMRSPSPRTLGAGQGPDSGADGGEAGQGSDGRRWDSDFGRRRLMIADPAPPQGTQDGSQLVSRPKAGPVAVRALVADRYGPTDFPISRAFRRVMDPPPPVPGRLRMRWRRHHERSADDPRQQGATFLTRFFGPGLVDDDRYVAEPLKAMGGRPPPPLLGPAPPAPSRLRLRPAIWYHRP